MTETPPTNEPAIADDSVQRGIEPWFAYAAGFLLCVIIAALLGLALRYRQRALDAEAAVLHLRQMQESNQTTLEQLMRLKPGESLKVVPSEEPTSTPPRSAEGSH